MDSGKLTGRYKGQRLQEGGRLSSTSKHAYCVSHSAIKKAGGRTRRAGGWLHCCRRVLFTLCGLPSRSSRRRRLHEWLHARQQRCEVVECEERRKKRLAYRAFRGRVTAATATTHTTHRDPFMARIATKIEISVRRLHIFTKLNPIIILLLTLAENIV